MEDAPTQCISCRLHLDQSLMHRFSKHLLRTTRSASYQHQRLYATTLNGALQPETKLAPVPTVKENTGETGPNEQDAMLVDAGEQRMSDCNHGLADFFRAKQVRILDTETDSRGEIYKVTKEVVRLVTLEPVSSDSDPSGRPLCPALRLQNQLICFCYRSCVESRGIA